MNNDRDQVVILEEAERVYARSGYRAAISRIIELQKQLAKHRYIEPGFIAYSYAALGDEDQMFVWLEKAYSEKAGSLQFLKVVKPMDPYRSDPRYHDLLKRMGLPP